MLLPISIFVTFVVAFAAVGVSVSFIFCDLCFNFKKLKKYPYKQNEPDNTNVAQATIITKLLPVIEGALVGIAEGLTDGE